MPGRSEVSREIPDVLPTSAFPAVTSTSQIRYQAGSTMLAADGYKTSQRCEALSAKPLRFRTPAEVERAALMLLVTESVMMCSGRNLIQSRKWTKLRAEAGSGRSR